MLQHLELSRCDIGDEGCSYLATALSHNTQLKSLVLFGNPIGDPGYVEFGKHLQHNKTQELLDLQVDRHKISIVGCLALLAMISVNTTLLRLSTLLGTDVNGGEKQRLNSNIQSFLRLNQCGRRRLLEG